MNRKIRQLTVAALFSLATVSANAAQTVKIDFSWLGSNNYSMDGFFTFDESFNGTTNLVAGNLLTFSFTAYLNNNPIGTWNMADGVDAGKEFKFNFNTVTNEFRTGGGIASNNGQQWNTMVANYTPGNIGFQSGLTSSSIRQLLRPNASDSMLQGSNGLIAQTPTFINTTPVPEADTSAMLLMGAGLMGFIARRRKQVAA
jgi:hypothetical protein